MMQSSSQHNSVTKEMNPVAPILATPSCFTCGQEGHRACDCPSTACFYCQAVGHLKRDCPRMKQEEATSRQGSYAQGAVSPQGQYEQFGASGESIESCSSQQCGIRIGMTKTLPDYTMSVEIVPEKPSLALVDTGAQISLLNSKFSHMLTGKQGHQVQIQGIVPGSPVVGQLVGAQFLISGVQYAWSFVLLDMSRDMVVGADFLKAHDAIITNSELRLQHPGQSQTETASGANVVIARWGALRPMTRQRKGPTQMEMSTSPDCSLQDGHVSQDREVGEKLVMNTDDHRWSRPLWHRSHTSDSCSWRRRPLRRSSGKRCWGRNNRSRTIYYSPPSANHTGSYRCGGVSRWGQGAYWRETGHDPPQNRGGGV